MTHPGRTLRALAALGWLATSGCTALREIPRAEYAARAERKGVVVETREGLEYRFDYARFEGDTLIGYRTRETEGTFEESHMVPIALESVAKLSARGVDWLRTGLIGAAVVAAVVTAVTRGSNGGTDSGTPIEPPPIP